MFIIYCEGIKREVQYFRYFHEISSQIRFEIIAPEAEGNNSPTGLYEQACQDIIKNEENVNPKYDLNKEDEVWFVIDTDTWGDKITELRQLCSQEKWQIAQSNPCFEVWLYYHKEKKAPQFEGMEAAKEWKRFLNDKIYPGGFNSRKHPILIKDAIDNAKKNYVEENGKIQISSTEVFKLAENFYPLIQKAIEEALANS